MMGNKRIVAAVLCIGLLIGAIAIALQPSGGPAPAWPAAADDFPERAETASASGEAAIVAAAASTVSADDRATPNAEEEIAALAAMEPVAENETLKLFIKRETAEIAVKDKRDGYVWFSNPVGHGGDPIASPLYKSELSSQLLLTYYNEKGQTYSFNSFDDSVNKQQFDVQATDRGVKVVYRFGNVPAKTDNIPALIGKERFEQRILNKLADDEARKQVTYKYRFNKEKQVYEVRKLQDNVAAELSALLASAGYTKEDADEDNAANGAAKQEEGDEARFTIPVVYSLEGEHLVVAIPAKEVEFKPSYPLASVQVLKYFGAPDGSQEGYLFVPDGSGALIRLNNQKLNDEPYRMPVYGEDGTFDVKERIVTSETTRLPVFGLKRGDRAFIGIMEQGEALASVMADIGGRFVSYNSVNGSFQFTAMDFYTLSSGTKTSSVPMFQKEAYRGDIRVRYAFLSGRSANYVGMAGVYRNYLISKLKLAKLAPKGDSPFILELAGAFRKRQSFLGIPYESTESLTTYAEAIQLLAMLKEQGIESVALRYVGWFNGGIRHSSPESISVDRALGGKSGFNKLIEYAARNGIRLYPDAAFLEQYKGSGGSAIFLDRRKAGIYEYDPVTYMKDTSRFSHYVLSPVELPGKIDGFLDDYAKFGIGGLSLRDLGSVVNSDFDPSSPVDRQKALETIVRETGKLRKAAGSLMVSGGNAYALPYADIVVHAPTASSSMNITDEDVPFYQIALHGYVEMAGEPFNMDRYENPRISMLKALETGSNVHYQWFYGPSSAVKDTDFNGLYALHYEDWFDEAAALYKEANPVLAKVRGQIITGHRKLADQVTETTFENGVTVIVNYGKTPVQANGMEIGAESFRVGGERSK